VESLRRFALTAACLLWLTSLFSAQSDAVDPGVRSGGSTGDSLSGLSAGQFAAFQGGADDFNSTHSVDGSVAGADASGLGPVFNLDNCGGCHAFPAVGGTSPSINPQVAMATKAGANNDVPFFIGPQGPIREVRFVNKPDGTPDGGVHAIFTIAGRTDARGCRLDQPDFDTESRHDNLAFRIPTPVFGDGLIENIPDSAILANRDADSGAKQLAGISGRENRSGNDGTITRFGWKAQNPSLAVFSGEAYNVEMGVTNEMFPTERNQSSRCQFNNTPEDHPDFDSGDVSGVQNFTNFMRFVGPPLPAHSNSSIASGRAVFGSIGCTLCHTPSMRTAKSDIDALSDKPVNLFSDLLLHDMGSGLADRIRQGNASGSEFRTAPLWGVGQRIFFLHDGRTRDLKRAITEHRSSGSEANAVIDLFNNLPPRLKQDLLNFLRSL
jgi:CxxC motif-containing protein (DUF1111 family)